MHTKFRDVTQIHCCEVFCTSLINSDDFHFNQPPPKVVMGKSVRVRITQAVCESGIADCMMNLHGRVTLHKGDPPLTTQALKLKLEGLRPNVKNWSVIPLGRGFF